MGIPMILATMPFDPWWAIFILFGLFLGWMARVGRMVGQHKRWVEIRLDLLVSVLVGGGNGLLATIIIFGFGLNYLQGVGVAFICAFAGVRTLEMAVRWAFRKFMEDASGSSKHDLEGDDTSGRRD